jgi:hypothetical protein
VIQIELVVRTALAGQHTAFGRICDAASSVLCEGLPPANAIPSFSFTVAPAPPPPTVTADELTVRVPNCFGCAHPYDLSITRTLIKVSARLGSSHGAGVFSLQMQRPGQALQTVASRDVIASSSTFNHLDFDATPLTPGTLYSFRACFRPAGGTRTCGALLSVSTLN